MNEPSSLPAKESRYSNYDSLMKARSERKVYPEETRPRKREDIQSDSMPDTLGSRNGSLEVDG